MTIRYVLSLVLVFVVICAIGGLAYLLVTYAVPRLLVMIFIWGDPATARDMRERIRVRRLDNGEARRLALELIGTWTPALSRRATTVDAKVHDLPPPVKDLLTMFEHVEITAEDYALVIDTALIESIRYANVIRIGTYTRPPEDGDEGLHWDVCVRPPSEQVLCMTLDHKNGRAHVHTRNKTIYHVIIDGNVTLPPEPPGRPAKKK
jgi:hypothetical protein